MKAVFFTLSMVLGACNETVNKFEILPDSLDSQINLDEMEGKIEIKNAAKYRGHKEVTQIIGERVFNDPGKFNLRWYVEEKAPQQGDIPENMSLLDLLGGFSGTGLKSEKINSTPNTINMILWFLALDGFSKDLSRTCTPSDKNFNPGFPAEDLKDSLKSIVGQLCAVKGGEQLTDNLLAEFFETIAQHDLSEPEYEAWLNFAKNDVYQRVSSQEAVYELLMSIFYHPQFLLSH